MTVAKEKETELKKKPEKKTIWTTEERSNIQTLYGCDILVENGSLDDVRTKKAPVSYTHLTLPTKRIV